MTLKTVEDEPNNPAETRQTLNARVKFSDIPCELVASQWGCDISEGELYDFCDVFLDVWNRIPSLDRTVIAERWNRSNENAEQLREVKVEFGPWRDEFVARACVDGCDFQIAWPSYRRLPVEIRRDVLAHELGHVFHYSKGLGRHRMSPIDLRNQFGEVLPHKDSEYQIKLSKLEQVPLKAEALVEIYANSMAERWGFSSISLRSFYKERFDKSGTKERTKPLLPKTVKSHAEKVWDAEHWRDLPNWYRLVEQSLQLENNLKSSNGSKLEVRDCIWWEGIVVCTETGATYEVEGKRQDWVPGVIMHLTKLLRDCNEVGRVAVRCNTRTLTIERT